MSIEFEIEAEPTVRVDDDVQIGTWLSFNVSFLDKPGADYDDLRTQFKDQLELTSDILAKGIIVNSLLEAASIWDSDVSPPGLDNLICYDLSAATNDFLQQQNGIFRDYNIEITDDGDLHYKTEYGSIFITIEYIGNFSGSFLSRRTIRIFTHDFRSIGKGVAIALITTAILSTNITTRGEDNQLTPILITASQEPLYICYLDKTIIGNIEHLYDSAASDLRMLPHYSDEEKKLVIRSRQACLKAAGFDPGPIDGIHGPQTEKAAQAFAYYHGDIVVNWNSVIFLRFLVLSAAERQNKSGR